MGYMPYGYTRERRRRHRILMRQIKTLVYMVLIIIILAAALLGMGFIANHEFKDPSVMMERGVPKNQINSFGGSQTTYTYTITD